MQCFDVQWSGATLAVPAGTPLLELLENNLAKEQRRSIVAARWNGELTDLTTPVTCGGTLELVEASSEAGLEVLRHSTAHVLAMAVQQLYPGSQVSIGPVIKDGFYYDFSFPSGTALSDSDLPRIEQEMRRIVKQNLRVQREVKTRAELTEWFTQLGEHYKVSILSEIDEQETLTLYRMGTWGDLCRGPHVTSTGTLKAFKLTKVAGAYWRGDEAQPMLTRIYGTAWASPEDLEHHLACVQEAKRRDHRVLGPQLDLFSFHGEAAGHPFFHPKGAHVLAVLRRYIQMSNEAFGFSQVETPLVMQVDLWKKSGHYENYRENMYFVEREDLQAAIKPMNCPGHCLIYRTRRRSYRELPLRYAEFGKVHRHERSGALSGLFRVRAFTQDDAHVFCTPDQVTAEVGRMLRQIFRVYQDFGLRIGLIELSTRPASSIGSDAEWAEAEASLRAALEAMGCPFRLNPGDGAFYGPKIDLHLEDALQRSWQCGTIQLDFSMPQRFSLDFVGADDRSRPPVLIHRAVLGSFERFFAVLLEHCAGALPRWLAPEQVRVLPVGDKYHGDAEQVAAQLRQAGVRVHADLRREKLGAKIRDAEQAKIPDMLVIGEQERRDATVSLRAYQSGQLDSMSVADFLTLRTDDWSLPSRTHREEFDPHAFDTTQ